MEFNGNDAKAIVRAYLRFLDNGEPEEKDAAAMLWPTLESRGYVMGTYTDLLWEELAK